jgi:uncharacterized membrane protein YidH (DUF202 family)
LPALKTAPTPAVNADQLLHLGVNRARLLLGLPLIALGAAAGMPGLGRWRISELAMRSRTPLPRSGPALLAAGIAETALFSLILALAQLRS